MHSVYYGITMCIEISVGDGTQDTPIRSFQAVLCPTAGQITVLRKKAKYSLPPKDLQKSQLILHSLVQTKSYKMVSGVYPEVLRQWGNAPLPDCSTLNKSSSQKLPCGNFTSVPG